MAFLNSIKTVTFFFHQSLRSLNFIYLKEISINLLFSHNIMLVIRLQIPTLKLTIISHFLCKILINVYRAFAQWLL